MTVDEMMLRMNFAPSDTGPYVTELRKLVARQIADGMTNRSAGTWAGDFDAETRAKAFLAIEWNMAHGHGYRVDCIDSPFGWRYDFRANRRYFEIDWRRMPLWFKDRMREAAMRWRIWRDRKLVNPSD